MNPIHEGVLEYTCYEDGTVDRWRRANRQWPYPDSSHKQLAQCDGYEMFDDDSLLDVVDKKEQYVSNNFEFGGRPEFDAYDQERHVSHDRPRGVIEHLSSTKRGSN